MPRRAGPSKPPKRAYSSERRQAQALESRGRILDAILDVMRADPNGDFSIPEVAARARLSVATVYKHFPNKLALRDALRARVDAQLGLNERPTTPQDLPGVVAHLQRFYTAWETVPPEIKALAHSPAANEDRVRRRPERLAWIEQIFADQLATLPEAERLLARDVLAVVASSAMADALHIHAGLDAKRATARMEWLLRRLFPAPPSPTKRRRR